MNQKLMHADEIEFISPYQVDGAGRVFSWNGDIYRGIVKERAAEYADLLRGSGMGSLVNAGLVPTEITSLTLPPYELVLHHHTVPFVSYCPEWNVEMLRDAALTTINVGQALSKLGYIMADAHPWNILFDGCKPLFVDVGSLVPLERQNLWPYMAFRSYFLFPLYLAANGYGAVTRSMQLQVFPVFTLGDVTRLLLGKMPLKALLQLRRIDRWLLQHSQSPTEEFFDRLREIVNLAPRSSAGTEWSSYQSIGEREGGSSRNDWPSKLRSVDQVLAERRPETVLDIGCNKGWFSRLAISYGAKVVGFDVDEPSLTALYLNGKQSGLPLMPLMIDVCQATPTHGRGGVYRSSQDRIQVDGVLSLATIHHLVFKQGMRFEAICKLHASYAKKWLLMEFVPAEDKHVESLMTRAYDWYRLEELCRVLRGYFKSVEVLESSPVPRKYLLCTK